MTKIGLVGAGARGTSHLRSVYTLREQEYFLNERGGGYPQWTYEEFVDPADHPEWVEHVGDMMPEVTAIFDPSEESRENAVAICGEHGHTPATYSDFEAFIDDGSFEAAVVASPNHAHAEQAIALLTHDIPVLSEKPIATTLRDHDRIADAVDSSSATYFVGFNLRSAPFYTRLQSMLAAGKIGELGMISCRECRGHFAGRYSFARERSGGAILNKNCHDFDLYNWYAESDPVSVVAYGGQHVHDRNTDVMDHATVSVRYANDVVGTLELCLYAPFGERTRMYELRGSTGILRAPDEQHTVDLYRRGSTDRFTVSARGGGHGGADVRQMKRFLQCLEGQTDPPASVEDAKKADVIALAAQQAVREDRQVHIDGDYDIVDDS